VREWTGLLRAVVTEVTLLPPATRPADPLARVVWVGEFEDSPAARVHFDRTPVAGEVILHEPGVRVWRHNVGEVLGVR
jgi:hypothetical protein